MPKKPKALVLFSGGLDSRLAVKILKQQVDVEAVFFLLPFGRGCCNSTECVFNYSQIQGVKLYIVDLTKGQAFEEYLKFVKEPEHGYGTAINPCKDCKIFLFKQAKKLADVIGADFLATGEVLGQRPMSQYKNQLLLTEKEAGLEGRILRPLSAKLLPITEIEKKKLVDRRKLLALKGRQRKKQIELAKKFKIKFPNSGGGCLLCEKEYEKKLRDLFKHKEVNEITPEDIQVLNIGRHFRKSGKIILGRNHEENKKLEILNKKLKYGLFEPKISGPTALFENKKDLKLVIEMVTAFSSKDLKLRKKFDKIKS